MDTLFLTVDTNNPEVDIIERVAAVIKAGGLVAFPTETVYGLGANGLDPEASRKVYAAKGRPSDNPLILHISEFSELDGIVKCVPKAAKALMEAFWPGPLTMVFNKADCVPYETTGGLDTVAVRMPSHPVARALIKASNVPIAAPSANSSGRPSPTRASHVKDDLNGKIDVILDGGSADIGLESTIIDVTSEIPVILRPGFITAEMAESVVGSVLYDKVVLAKSKEEAGQSKPKAPGMRYRHYAPKASFSMYSGELEKVIETIDSLVKKSLSEGKKVGIAATDDTVLRYPKDAVILSLGNRNQPETVAASLYDVLREFDDLGVDVIYGESFEQKGLGQAIMNRLIKACGYELIEV